MIEDKISWILHVTPKVEVLKLQGIKLYEDLNFCYPNNLEKLYFDYFPNCDVPLSTIYSETFTKLIVTNTTNNSKGVIFLDKLYDLFHEGRKDISFVDCEMYEPA